MIKALWLTSWYPNKLDAMNGDFIQRHARAVSLFCQVYVIHLEADKEGVLTDKEEVTVEKNESLTEEIVLYKPVQKFGLLGKAMSYHKYLTLFKTHIKDYIKENGLPEIVHVHVPMKAGILALWMKKKYGINYIVTEHWAIYNNDAPDAFSKRSFLFRQMTKKILRQCSVFTPVSQNLGEAIQQMVVDIPFTVVPNTTDTNFFNYTAKPSDNDDVFTFLHVSTLKHQKNPEAILRVYKQFYSLYPNSKLVITGHANNGLLQYASSLNIPQQNLEFTGLVSYTDVAEIMKKSDAFVMFSRYENLPCVIIEALCCGLPVISTDVGGISEVINETNGVLIYTQDEIELLKAFTGLYNSYQMYSRSRIAREASSKFSYYSVGEAVTIVYDRVIRK